VSDDDVLKSCELATVPARPSLSPDIAQVLVGLVSLHEPQRSHEAFRGHFWPPVEFLGARIPRGQVRTQRPAESAQLPFDTKV
jgi:hypothetical protein